jgi:uncharacterized protein (TIGR00106 family)
MIAELSVVPIGVGESLSEYVARALRVIRKSGVEHRLTDMGTILKARNFEELGKLVDEIIEELGKDCPRIFVVIKADERFRDVDLEHKVRAVERRLEGKAY